ncbi:MAG: efflux RND transporter permease subunit [Candidatus Sericytochromatia bacterium]|nr:efflux RND transporter permease subunit [Candidatus Tanganyikabacteria bacterium]
MTEPGGFNFSAPFIRRPVLTTMLVMLLMTLGIFGGSKLSMDLFPNVEFPVVLIHVEYPGAAPQEVEALVTKQIEEAVASAAGLESLRSMSFEGLSWTIARFTIETSAKLAAADCRDKVAAIRYRLPRDVKDPSFRIFDPSAEPIINYALQGAEPRKLTTLLLQVIKPRLESIDGVALIEVFGDRKREIQLQLDPERLASHKVSLLGVFGALNQENYNLPAGRYAEGDRDLSLRAMGKFRSLDELSRLQIPTPGGGTVQVRDLGRVVDTTKDPTTAAVADGVDAVMFGVIKQNGANAVKVGESVAQRMKTLEAGLPPGVKVVKATDASEFTKESNLSVWEHMTVGGLLAVAVLFLFLRSKAATFIGGLAIPLSVVGTFYFMHVAGFSFNLLTNLALSMVIGILVDDAVVDLENIYRHMERGKHPIRAAIDATREIQQAVTATTLTIVAVFVPVGFMTGMVGKFFKEFGLTVACAVLVSLLIARTVTPMLAARMLRVRVQSTPEGTEDGEDAETTGYWLAPHYRRLLAWALSHRGLVVAMAVVAFGLGIGLVPFIPKGFMTQADSEEFALVVKLPKGASMGAIKAAAGQVEALARKRPEVAHVFTFIGDRDSAADLYATLTPRESRKLSDVEVAQLIRDQAQSLPGMRTQIRVIGIVAQGDQNYPVNVEMRSDDLGKLATYSQRLMAMLKRHREFIDIDSSLAQARPEMQLILDRQRAAELGVSPAGVAQTLRLATLGDTTTTYTEGEYDYDVRVMADPGVKGDLERLAALTIPVPGRGSVAIGAVTELRTSTGYSQITRKNRQRVVNVVANTRPGVALGEATKLAESLAGKLDLPPDVQMDFGGQAEDMREVFTGLITALALAILFIYLILAVQFESFIHPFTIMLSMPLSVIGAFLALFGTRTELGMMAMIGLIMLMGIVTKNAILIVDFTLTLRQRGMDRLEALLHAGPIRLRPILMTTAAMVMGMLPMAFRVGAGSEFRYPMAIVVIGGLITSTALTLVVVPVFYTLLDDLGGAVRRRLGWGESARIVGRRLEAADEALRDPATRV